MPVAALMLEHRAAHLEGSGNVGAWIIDGVGGGGVEEAIEDRVIVGHRQLEERCTAEDDEAHAVPRELVGEVLCQRLGAIETGAVGVLHQHRAGEIERHKQVAT